MKYDPAGRRTSITLWDNGGCGSAWFYEFDGRGNVVTQTSPEETLWFEYDDLDRMTERRVGSSSGDLLAEWVFDGSGEKGLLDYSTSYDDDWTVTVDPTTYDSNGRVLDQEWRLDDPAVSGIELEYSMGWVYDPADRIVSVEYPNGESVAYEFDVGTGLASSATRSDGFELISSAAYTSHGQPLLWRFGSSSDALGVDRNWSYFADTLRFGNLGAKNSDASYKNIQNISHSYTVGGDVTRRMDWRNGSQAECSAYDGRGQLVSAFTTDDVAGTSNDCSNGHVVVGSGSYDHSYGFDAAGNLVDVDGDVWSYGEGSAPPHALTSTPSSSFGYDSAGRMVSRVVDGVSQTMVWTPTGMVSAVTSGSETTGFFYDADGDRVLRVDPDGSLTVTLADWFESEIPTAGGSVDVDHYWFDGQRVGFSSDDGSGEELWFVFGDRLGSSSVLYNHSEGGSIIRQWYDPWGSVRATTGTSPTDVGYTGQHLDPTGLMDYDARLYDPAHATFISPDTIVPDPTNPADLNRYTYVRNNPTNLTDPTGHETCGYRAVGIGQQLVCWSDYEQYTEFQKTGKTWEGNPAVDPVPEEPLPIPASDDWSTYVEVGGCAIWCFSFYFQEGSHGEKDGVEFGITYGVFGWPGLSLDIGARSAFPHEMLNADNSSLLDMVLRDGHPVESLNVEGSAGLGAFHETGFRKDWTPEKPKYWHSWGFVVGTPGGQVGYSGSNKLVEWRPWWLSE